MNMFIFPNHADLSLEALGILSTMLNLPECDYVTFEKLHSATPKDTSEDLRAGLTELENRDFVFRIDGKYAVNKIKIPQMMIVGGE